MIVVLSAILALLAVSMPYVPAALHFVWGNGRGLFARRYVVIKYHHNADRLATHGGKRFRTMFWAMRHNQRMNKLYTDSRVKFRVPEIDYFYTVKPLVALT
ncbi:gp007 [Rhodococcus phage ReqiPoco6]|uniref:Gp007 n=1 Tax=Rhodococcus phage ReqiPoco6 TaxID=691964 RepID=D4P7M5_9CAUD|nr:gp007 [Rhodococcus phage ReqiPoco6]ADD81005.1 gp007 [Rhodococcus phage ReqiPoco6]